MPDLIRVFTTCYHDQADYHHGDQETCRLYSMIEYIMNQKYSNMHYLFTYT